MSASDLIEARICNEAKLSLVPPTDAINTTYNILALLTEADRQLQMTSRLMRGMGAMKDLASAREHLTRLTGSVNNLSDIVNDY